MANLKTIQEALKQNCTIRNAEENLKLLQEQKESKVRIKEEFKKMGVMVL
jgi:hypothetical protein